MVSYYTLKVVLGERVEEIGGTSKLYTIGIGAYFVSWLFLWILVYTVFFHVWLPQGSS
jgi:hypothetical protein